MQDINYSLEKIMDWLKQNQPEFADSFLPGITIDEIKKIEKEIGFKLSEEICKLYQWRNGTTKYGKALFFPSIQYLPFEEALMVSQDISFEISSEEDGYFYENKPIFTFIFEENEGCAIPLEKVRLKKTPVLYFFGEEPELSVCYKNLTTMMQLFAECYETGAYYLDNEGFTCEDEYKVSEIFSKYNV